MIESQKVSELNKDSKAFSERLNAHDLFQEQWQNKAKQQTSPKSTQNEQLPFPLPEVKGISPEPKFINGPFFKNIPSEPANGVLPKPWGPEILPFDPKHPERM